MKKREAKTTVVWEVDPAGQWASKKESLQKGDGVRTVIYRPAAAGQAGAVASWWDTRTVETSGYRNRSFEVATPCFETVNRSFSSILDEARAAVAAQPAPEPVAPLITIPPALSYLASRP